MSVRDDEQSILPLGEENFEEHADRAEEAPAGAADGPKQWTRLHEHVEHLPADRRPPRPKKRTKEEARAYQAAALLRAAAPGAADPRAEFLEALRGALEHALESSPPARPPQTVVRLPKRRALSRRALFTAGLGA